MVIFELIGAGVIVYALSVLTCSDTRPLGWTNIEFDHSER